MVEQWARITHPYPMLLLLPHTHALQETLHFAVARALLRKLASAASEGDKGAQRSGLLAQLSHLHPTQLSDLDSETLAKVRGEHEEDVRQLAALQVGGVSAWCAL